jgi:hypothetical protein
MTHASTQTTLGTTGARQLAHTTKSVPQMQGLTPRWLLRMLPWVQVSGGVYRVNRRLSYAVGGGRLGFTSTGAQVQIGMSAGHAGEPVLPETFVDYDLAPREYELAVVQTVLKIHTRVSDLYNQPMNQSEQQLRLTIEALRERQEHELVNHREFGLLHNADLKQRIHPRSGPPTPDDLDELLSRRRKSQLLLAHPRTIAAFHRECNRRGLYPIGVELAGRRVPAWRGVPLLPCDKLPITRAHTSSILVMRLGADSQGVIGLRHAGLPDEVEPGLSVRWMGIDDQAITSYLVSAWFSAAVLVPDALGILEDVQIG